MDRFERRAPGYEVVWRLLAWSNGEA
jgi:hypothetical protein